MSETAPGRWQDAKTTSLADILRVSRELLRRQPPGAMRFSWAPPEPPRRISPRWYLAWPTPMAATWFCMPGFVEETNEIRPRRVYAAYCGAPSGVRCRCGAQLVGHDAGDEQP